MPNSRLTKQDAELLAAEVSHKVVSELFDKFDIDLSNKEALVSFRDDLRFLREQRVGQELLRQNIKRGALYLIGTALMGITYLTWDALKLGIVTWVQNIR